MLILKTHRNSTLLETNISPENGPVAKETSIWKPSFLRADFSLLLFSRKTCSGFTREETHTAKIKQLFKKMGAAEGGGVLGLESSAESGSWIFLGKKSRKK